MTAETIKTLVPPPVEEPWAAQWAAAAAVALWQMLRRARGALRREHAAPPETPAAQWQGKGATRVHSSPLVPHWGIWL
jgi:hypothetical protein